MATWSRCLHCGRRFRPHPDPWNAGAPCEYCEDCDAMMKTYG